MTFSQDHSSGTLVGISFDDAFRAQEFLVAITGLASHKKLVLKDAVTILKDREGRVTVHETIDPSPGRAALSGGVWAGLFGLILGGPVGWIAGAAIGASTGAVAANVVDLGISDEWVAWFREAVLADTATVALLVDDVDRDALVTETARFTGARLVYASLDPATLERVRESLGARPPEAPADQPPGTDEA